MTHYPRNPFWYTAGELYDRQKAHPRESIGNSLDALATENAKPKKASNSVSKPPVLKCECPLDDGVRYTTHCGCSQCDYPNGAPIKPAKKVSENLSITHARELKIDDTVTVSDLFALIDRPYKVTRKAKVSIVTNRAYESFENAFTLRLEWTGGDE